MRRYALYRVPILVVFVLCFKGSFQFLIMFSPFATNHISSKTTTNTERKETFTAPEEPFKVKALQVQVRLNKLDDESTH